MIKVLNTLNCNILVFNDKNRLLFINNHLLKKIGKRNEDLINKDIYEVISFCEDYNYDLIKNLSNQKTYQYCIKNKDNQPIYIDGKIIQDTYNNQEAYYLVGEDNKYDMRNLEELLDIVQGECSIKDINGKYLYVNQQFADNLSMEKSNIIGKKSSDIFSKEDSDFLYNNERKVLKTKNILKKENVYFTRQDKKWYSNTTLKPILNENKEVKYIACFKLDITMTKLIDEILKIYVGHVSKVCNDIQTFDIEKQYKFLISNLTGKLKEIFKADEISILRFKEDKEISILSESGETLKTLRNKDIPKLYEYIQNLGEGIIKTEDLKEVEDLKNIYNELIKEEISTIAACDIPIENEIKGLLLTIYKNNNDTKNLSFNYLKYICSYISISINNWCKCKKIEEERRKYKKINNSLMHFVDISEEMISAWDLDGNLIYANKECTNILGYKDLSIQNFLDLLHPDDKYEILKLIYDSDKKFSYLTSRFKCSNNEYKWIEWNFKVLKDENLFFVRGKDISKSAEEKREKLLIQQAKFIEEMRDEFLSNITHEFRTPINIILGTVQLISRGLDNNTYKLENLETHIKYLRRNSNRLLRLVNNLIDITYIKNGYNELNLQNHNIVAIVESVCNTVINSKESRGRHIIFDTDTEEIIMACDADEIERIILNLLSNAIKYSFYDDSIEVNISLVENSVEISVKDYGIGIPNEYLDAIFEKLTRVENNIRRNNEGSGIGLAIVKSLVNLHGGTVRVESEVGKGSNFIVKIPIKLVNNKATTVFKSYNQSNKIEKCAVELSDIYD